MEPRAARKLETPSGVTSTNPRDFTSLGIKPAPLRPNLRVTRSTAQQASETTADSTSTSSTTTSPVNQTIAPSTPTTSARTLRKRKQVPSPSTDSRTPVEPSRKRSKSASSTQIPRSKASEPQANRKKEKQPSAPEMSDQGSSGSNHHPHRPTPSSKRRPQRSKKTIPPEAPVAVNPRSARASKVAPPPQDDDTEMGEAGNVPETSPQSDEDKDEEMKEHSGEEDEDQDEDGDEDRYPEDDYDDEDDVFDSHYLGGAGGPGGLSSTLRALSGLVSGLSSRFRTILGNLRQKDDPSTQLIALQDLSELLLVSTEDNLSGHFSPDQFIKELVGLMQDEGPFGENPEMMLLACRCIANLMEALPAATANVVYGGAVPVLCAKLMEIQYIDLAEQALSTLEKISVEYPTSIVREGGLTACLTYLDFFATNVQRTAVTAAANCCRNIPADCFSTIRDVMPILLGVLSSSDQKVVEQGCLCVARIVESFRHHPDKLEQLLSKDLLKAILQLLLPGTTNLVGQHIHTQFLRVLSITAKASPTLSIDLLNMSIVDTLYQILTGVSPPAGEEPSMKDSSVMTMQALIHKPREQIFETLNVICELLPSIPDGILLDTIESPKSSSRRRSSTSRSEETPDDVRRRLLKENKTTLRRFAAILLPTLTDAYTSTVNLGVRQKVLIAQLKMISNLDTEILEDALSSIKFASHLATILSQKDQKGLVGYGLHAAALLLRRLPNIYEYHFHREGVIHQIEELASKTTMEKPAEGYPDDGSDESHDEDEPLDSSPVSSRSSFSSRHMLPLSEFIPDSSECIARLARNFMDAHEKDGVAEMKAKAREIMASLSNLADALRTANAPQKVFRELSSFFADDDSLQSITTFELLKSGIVEALLFILGDTSRPEVRRSFLQIFMARRDGKDTPFTVLVKKLQDLLSRSEHFEIVTVHQSYDGNRSSASMLAKQLRLKLVADEDSDIPRNYRNIMVSIHAIANFKALDDYLRPRIYLSDRPKGASRSERSGGLSSALAAFAAAAGLPPPQLPPGMPSSGEGASTSGQSSRRSPKSSKRSSHKKGSAVPETASSSTKSSHREPSRRAPQTPDQERLECMDEKQVPDDDDDMEDMDAVLDDLEGEMHEAQEPETSAVDMDIRESKPTPPSTKGSARRLATDTGTADNSPVTPKLSHAAAVQASAKDWHIKFSINGHEISNDMTIYKAVQLGRSDSSNDGSYRNIWSSIHPIKFQRVQGPAPSDASLSPGVDNSASSVPVSLDENDITSSILRLLSVLHALNANIDDVFQDIEADKPYPQSVSQFVNTKLTAKLNRQLEEPLIVASACLPSWSEDLARFYPFLFPFETRHLYLQSTSFGYSRSMTRWQNSQQSSDSRQDRHRDENRPFLGRLQRQKVRISRDRILESAIKVMEIYGASPSVLEVEYFEEVGTGLGPTLEFYSSVSRAFVSKRLKLWRKNDFNDQSEYAYGAQGLFPAPMSDVMAESENGKKQLHLFRIMGKFVARSMLDSRIIDIFFNPTFFRTGEHCDSAVPPSLGAVKSVDKDLAKSLKLLRKFAVAKKGIEDNQILTARGKQERYKEITFEGVKVEDLELDFTLPGYPEIELISNGSNTKVTIHNVSEYVDKVIDLTLGSGVQRQVDAFRAGFSQVFPYSALRSFTPDELVMLFGQVEEDWSMEALMDSMKADHGFNMDSKTVQNLLVVMSGYNVNERRDFLQFVTGSPKLPIGGFKALTPLLTVVCKASEPPYTSDDYLPSVMTCVNYLKLPDYSSLEVLRERLQVAIKEGQGAFHLS